MFTRELSRKSDIIIIYIYLTAIGLYPGGSSTTIGHNRQVTHITQSNNIFKQDTNTIHHNKEHPTAMNTKQIRTTENTNTTRKKTTRPKTQLIKNTTNKRR
jgi:hypothetical protein